MDFVTAATLLSSLPLFSTTNDTSSLTLIARVWWPWLLLDLARIEVWQWHSPVSGRLRQLRTLPTSGGKSDKPRLLSL